MDFFSLPRSFYFPRDRFRNEKVPRILDAFILSGHLIERIVSHAPLISRIDY